MKSDLNIPKVEGVEIVVVKRYEDDTMWDIMLLNRSKYALQNVLISSRGYGMLDGRDQKTSTLRHLIEILEANSYVKIEPIQQGVFHLTNEYWVSYYIDDEIYDKKYIFLPDTIQEKYIVQIKDFDLEGVLHT